MPPERAYKNELQRMDRTDQKARMAYGNNLAFPSLDAVEDSVITVGDFAYIGIAEFRDFSTAQSEIRQMFNGAFHIKKPIIGGLRIVVLRNTSSIFRESSLPVRRPDDFHGRNSLRRLSKTSLCGMPLPSSSSVIPASISRLVSIHSTSSSQSSTLPMKEVGRPFCVMKMRRCVSAVRFRHAARLLRHSEKEMTSSERRGVGNAARRRLRTDNFSLTAGIGYYPFLMAYIVHDYVHESK